MLHMYTVLLKHGGPIKSQFIEFIRRDIRLRGYGVRCCGQLNLVTS